MTLRELSDHMETLGRCGQCGAKGVAWIARCPRGAWVSRGGIGYGEWNGCCTWAVVRCQQCGGAKEARRCLRLGHSCTDRIDWRAQ